MSTVYKIVFLFLVSFFVNFSSIAQTTPPTKQTVKEELSLNKSNIAGQFDFINEKSNGWKDGKGQRYEVVKIQYLSQLKAHVLDSIKATKNDFRKAKTEIVSQNKQISTLKKSLEETQISLNNLSTEKDNISFLGLSLTKTSYSILLFSIIGLLMACVAFFAFQFKNSNVLTKNAKEKLNELEFEFDEHRKTALEREQKVRRQLQDEINKNRGK
jgi:hypothetical protein